jgi:hypothetical protein
MDVTRVAQDWPERAMRQRSWVSPAGLFERIEESGLVEVLRVALERHYATP